MDTDDDPLDWETWNPTQLSFVQHMIAGSGAGVAEHVTMYPVDTLKTHIQCQRCGNISPSQTWTYSKQFLREEGVFRLWRGVSSIFIGCIPAHAAYFSVFELGKTLTGADKEGHHPMKAAACGAVSSISHDSIMNPFDVVKQRMQLGYYKNMMHCLRTIVRTEGVLALYSSFPMTLMMNLPYSFVMVPINESVRKLLTPDGKYSFSASMIAGSVAGAVAAAVTNPLDVIKTRIQTRDLQPCPRGDPAQCGAVPSALRITRVGSSSISSSISSSSGNSSSASGMRVIGLKPSLFTMSQVTPGSSSVSSPGAAGGGIPSAGKPLIRSFSQSVLRTFDTIGGFTGISATVSRIIKEDGWMGFTRGVIPRVIAQTPSVAISWTAYESFKSLLRDD